MRICENNPCCLPPSRSCGISSLGYKVVTLVAALFLAVSLLSIAGHYLDIQKITIIPMPTSLYVGISALVVLTLSLGCGCRCAVLRNFDFYSMAKTDLLEMDDFLHQHQFYYELTNHVDQVRGTVKQEACKTMLQKLHGKTLTIKGKIFLLDTQLLQQRLERPQETQLDVGVLQEADREQFTAAHKESFGNECGHAFDAKDTFFVVAKDGATVVGGVVIQKLPDDVFLVFSLCRLANRAKVGLTKAMKTFLEKHTIIPSGAKLACLVAPHNFAAKKIYENLGFKCEGENAEGNLIMRRTA